MDREGNYFDRLMDRETGADNCGREGGFDGEKYSFCY